MTTGAWVIHHPKYGYLSTFANGGCRWDASLQNSLVFWNLGKAKDVANCFTPEQREGMTILPVKEVANA